MSGPEIAFSPPTFTTGNDQEPAVDANTCPKCHRANARQVWPGFGRGNVRTWCRFCHADWPEVEGP